MAAQAQSGDATPPAAVEQVALLTTAWTLLGRIADALCGGTDAGLQRAVDLLASAPGIESVRLTIGAVDGRVAPRRFEAGPPSAFTGPEPEPRHCAFPCIDGRTECGRLEVALRVGSEAAPPVGWLQCAAALVTLAVVRRHTDFAAFAAARTIASGEIAAGLVHDFNNLMTAILGYTAVLRQYLGETSDATGSLHMLSEVDSIVRAAAQLARHLLRFVRGQDEYEPSMEVEELLRGSAALVAPAITGIDIRIDVVPGLRVAGVRALLEQALVNLLLNAAQATGGSGEVTLRARPVRLPEASSGPATCVALCVLDRGPGLGDVDGERLFQPFVSTKARGMGLGLVVVRRIAERFGGFVRASNRPRGGAAFAIYLPLADGERCSEDGRQGCGG